MSRVASRPGSAILPDLAQLLVPAFNHLRISEQSHEWG